MGSQGVHDVISSPVASELKELDGKFEPLMPYLSKTRADSNPHIVLIWAQSLDGKISPSSMRRYPLSGWKAWYFTHKMRLEADVIVIGAQTAVTDDPSLIGETNAG